MLCEIHLHPHKQCPKLVIEIIQNLTFTINMQLQLIDIILLILISSFAYLWWQGKAIKEKALPLVKDYCKKMDVQLLDDTISIKKTIPIWHNRQAQIKRTFLFEFTVTGELRYEGKIEFISDTLHSINLEVHQFK